MVYSLLWPGIGMYYSLMPFFAFLMFYAVERSTHFDHWFCIAILSAICCFFSFSGGIFIWIGILAYLVLKDDINRKLKILATCVSAGFIVFLNYFVLQINGTSTLHGFELLSGWISHPIQLIISFTSLVGTNTIHNSDFMWFTGGIILLLLFSVIWTNKHSFDFNETSVWYGLIIYGCTVMAALLFLRGDHLEFVMMPSLRHSTSTLFLLAGLLPLAYYYYSRTRRIQVQTEQSQNNRDVQLILLTLISCMMVLSAAFHFLPGIDIGYGWLHAQSNEIDALYGNTIDDMKWDGLIRDHSIFMLAKDSTLHSIRLKHIYTHIKYFDENQLNLYDQSQSICFTGIWNNIRKFVHFNRMWERGIGDWIIPVRYNEQGEIVSMTYNVFYPAHL